MRVHKVKSWPAYFSQIVTGLRAHELRRNDRNYQVGDRLELFEYLPESGEYSGRSCVVEITSMTSGDVPCAVSREALNPAFCILSVRLVR